MTYRMLSTGVALICITLCLTLMFAPTIIYWLFGLDGNALGDFMTKRAGVLFLGLAILCFASRNTTSPEVIQLVSLSLGVAMLVMALLGVFELARGNAGLGILLAVVAELIIAALFWKTHSAARSQR